MALKMEDECPSCGEETFWRVASTQLHLGEKEKWTCASCEYGFVTIDDEVDTRARFA